jgi:hypothetical protein
MSVEDDSSLQHRPLTILNLSCRETETHVVGHRAALGIEMGTRCGWRKLGIVRLELVWAQTPNEPHCPAKISLQNLLGLVRVKPGQEWDVETRHSMTSASTRSATGSNGSAIRPQAVVAVKARPHEPSVVFGSSAVGWASGPVPGRAAERRSVASHQQSPGKGTVDAHKHNRPSSLWVAPPSCLLDRLSMSPRPFQAVVVGLQVAGVVVVVVVVVVVAVVVAAAAVRLEYAAAPL